MIQNAVVKEVPVATSETATLPGKDSVIVTPASSVEFSPIEIPPVSNMAEEMLAEPTELPTVADVAHEQPQMPQTVSTKMVFDTTPVDVFTIQTPEVASAIVEISNERTNVGTGSTVKPKQPDERRNQPRKIEAAPEQTSARIPSVSPNVQVEPVTENRSRPQANAVLQDDSEPPKPRRRTAPRPPARFLTSRT